MADNKGIAPVSVPTESPVPGVNIELATLLVQAVKCRRKFLSKSSSSAPDAARAGEEAAHQRLLQDLHNSADDRTTAFLNELRRQVDIASSASKSNASSSNRKRRNELYADAPANCLGFLLDVLSDGENSSIHLRRASLAVAKEILERSSNARAHFSSGRRLLDFVSVIEGVENDCEDEDTQRNIAQRPSSLSPTATFQLEGIELVQHLATKFGKFYTQFTVAERILGDVNIHQFNGNDAHLSKNARMQKLRGERDSALEHGPKACQSLGRMIKRADELLLILVPRLGGFHAEPPPITAEIAVEPSETRDFSPSERHGDNAEEDEDDDDSIDWEEGDIGASDDNHNDNTEDATSNLPVDETVDHQAAVEETLNIMGRGGALLDGRLAVQVGDKPSEIVITPFGTTTQADASACASSQQPNDAKNEARQKLHHAVEKLSTRRLPRLNRWIHALSNADGMRERVVVSDPATEATSGNSGPASLVLLSEEKRALRSELLQRMIKIRKEIEGVLNSAAKLGINPEGGGMKQGDSGVTDQATATENVTNTQSANGAAAENNAASVKRQWNDTFALAGKRKKPKSSRFKVIYRNEG